MWWCGREGRDEDTSAARQILEDKTKSRKRHATHLSLSDHDFQFDLVPHIPGLLAHFSGALMPGNALPLTTPAAHRREVLDFGGGRRVPASGHGGEAYVFRIALAFNTFDSLVRLPLRADKQNHNDNHLKKFPFASTEVEWRVLVFITNLSVCHHVLQQSQATAGAVWLPDRMCQRSGGADRSPGLAPPLRA